MIVIIFTFVYLPSWIQSLSTFQNKWHSHLLVVCNTSSYKIQPQKELPSKYIDHDSIQIRTNHKDALHIQPTHDYIEPHAKKDFSIKLVENHVGVKLEINYTKAIEEMIAKKDFKMKNVDERDIKKTITKINVDKISIPEEKG